jgi:hypothetical protein
MILGLGGKMAIEDDIADLKCAFKAYIDIKKQEDMDSFPISFDGITKKIIDNKYRNVDKYLGGKNARK